MKKAPNWSSPKDPVNGIWKQDLLRYLGEEFDLRILVETGTCEASTIEALHNDFDEIHSIELSLHYYNISKQRTANFKNVHLYQGNSDYLLGEVLFKIRKPRLLFWLDAHSSGGMTANEGDPLPHEIKAILDHAPNSIIVIDDQQDTALNQVASAGISLEGWIRHYISGELILFREGMYTLPTFED